MLSELFDRGKGFVAPGLSLQDREPDLHLIEPFGVMQREPAVVFGFAGIEVVEHDVDGFTGPSGDNVVHEVEELDAPPARLL
jgi:hypothetical protein